MSHHWGYGKENGPSTWPHVAPAAKGLHQSPVDIQNSSVKYEPSLAKKPLTIRYIPANSKNLLNNGHSVQVLIDGTDSLLEGGPYEHKYRAEQFHFHWGSSDSTGAEHLVDGKTYAAELHIVHWNTEVFSSFAEAAKGANGLGVLGVFLEPGDENTALKKLTDLLPNVTYAGDTAPVPGGFDPASLLPADRTNYWTYTGSLTTPPCYESVRFLIFKDPIQVSPKQLQAFRNLHSNVKGEDAHDDHHGQLMDNYRPPLPLNDRQILASFH